jgi:catechol 2,3-dioxygenase-like lactoylglutathione lyase family enzyme
VSTLPHLSHCAPVRIVDAVEPSIAFWRDRFGLRVENEVPGPDGTLVFASVTNGSVELMYQTRASVLADTLLERRDARGQELAGDATVLFFHVDDIDAAEHALAGLPVEKPRHDTFYGTTEIYVREPGGMVVGFSARRP